MEENKSGGVWVKGKRNPEMQKVSNMHQVLHRRHGKATKCENQDCNYPNPKRFEWALKKGREYSSNKEDYIQLCPSCHRKYDFTEDIREKLRESHLGSRTVAAKLKDDDVLIIVSLIKEGVQNKEIAKMYNIDNSTVSDIKRGKRWNHLTKIKVA